MSNGLKSIEDLILASSDDGFVDEDSSEGKFVKKQQEIKIKEAEVSAQKKAALIGHNIQNSKRVDLFIRQPETRQHED